MSHAGFKQTHKTTGVKYALLFSCFCVCEREGEQDRERMCMSEETMMASCCAAETCVVLLVYMSLRVENVSSLNTNNTIENVIQNTLLLKTCNTVFEQWGISTFT